LKPLRLEICHRLITTQGDAAAPHCGTSISTVCDLQCLMGGRVGIWFVVIVMTAVWLVAVYFVFSQPISANHPLALSK
jgi:uncharacterized membrane protein